MSFGKETRKQKKQVIKRKRKFENYEEEWSLEATQFDNEKGMQKKIKLTQIVSKRIMKNS